MNGTPLRLASPIDVDTREPRPTLVDVSPAFMHAGLHLRPQRLPARARRELSRHLGFRVARRPADLVAHTRRILLNAAIGDPDACYAALLDLFWVLGHRGSALRQRLLRAVAPVLEPAQRSLLGLYLRAGELNLEAEQINPHCRLARARSGLHLVRRAREAQPA